ncbi:MAG: ABC transporter permease [Bacteroidales bacterium]|nr:ABC transporter permease [Bacteroidales bacterium]MDD3664956.1 ABC transporter permease [Bacteroidales bacterium]
MKHALFVFFRQFRRRPVIHLISIGGLAIGVAIFTLIMLYVKKEFDHDRDVPHSQRIVRMEFGDWCVLPPAIGSYLSNRTTGVEQICRLLYQNNLDVVSDRKHFRIDYGVCVDSTFPAMFGLKFLQGNPATALADPTSVILTQSTALKLFGTQNPLGKTLEMPRKVSVTVTAVVADANNIHLHYDMIMPIRYVTKSIRPDFLDNFRASNFPTYLLLAEGANPKAVEMAIAADLKKNIYHDESTDDIGLRLRPLNEIYFFNTAQYEAGARHGNLEVTWVLLAVGVLILLLAIINFINLSTAEALGRARESGLRKILGARRHNLLGGYLTESFFISLLSVMLGLTIGWLLLPWFNTLSGSSISLSIPWYLLLLSPFVLSILAGIAPALVLASFSPVQAMRGALVRGRRAATLRTALVVTQFAISIALITATVIVWRQFHYLNTKEMGFDRHGVVHFPIRGDVWKHAAEIRNRFKQEALISEVALSQGVPGSMFNTETHTINNREIPFRIMQVDPWFVDAMGIRIVSGRNFDPAVEADKKQRILINETAAKAIGWEQPLGQKFTKKEGGWALQAANPEVIGVMADFQFDGLSEPVRPLVFVFDDRNLSWATLRFDPRNQQAVLDLAANVWKEWEPVYTFDYKLAGQLQQDSMQTQARLADVFVALALVALLIAALGQLGMAGYVTRKRMREMAIRKVNGATEQGLMVLLYRSFGRWVVVAALVAVPLALPLAQRWLDSFPYHVDPGWIAPLIALAVTLVVCLLTVTWHGIKAVVANPSQVLRWE